MSTIFIILISTIFASGITGAVICGLERPHLHGERAIYTNEKLSKIVTVAEYLWPPGFFCSAIGLMILGIINIVIEEMKAVQ